MISTLYHLIAGRVALKILPTVLAIKRRGKGNYSHGTVPVPVPYGTDDLATSGAESGPQTPLRL